MEPRIIPGDEALSRMREAFSAGKSFALTVTGTSMSPVLRNRRDAVFLVSPQKRPPQKYDILLFRRQDALILHRIIAVKKDGSFIVNGDAQTWCEQVRPEQILAVAETLLRKGRRISCGNAGYRFLCFLWCKTRRFRPFLHRIRLFFQPPKV